MTSNLQPLSLNLQIEEMASMQFFCTYRGNQYILNLRKLLQVHFILFYM
jgi:hypothetical protein